MARRLGASCAHAIERQLLGKTFFHGAVALDYALSIA